MRKTLLFVLLSLAGLSSFGQKILFSNNTNTWSMKDSTLACCIPYPTRYTTTHYNGRVIYNGTTYQSLVYDLGSCLIREEAGRVYFIGAFDSTERILYDFNLGLNDTLRTVYPEGTYVAWVSQIDSTQLYGKWYKTWRFDGLDYHADSTRPFWYNVIEGIGCTNGPYYPAAPYDLAAYSDQLLCFTNDMGITTGLSKPVNSYGAGYYGSFDNAASCSLFQITPPHIEDTSLLRARQLVAKRGNAAVVPNPINETGRIILPYAMQSGSLVIMNSIGQVVSNTVFQNKDELPVKGCISLPGIYYYRITDAAVGNVFSGKFVY
jgi:hypothetical protein